MNEALEQRAKSGDPQAKVELALHYLAPGGGPQRDYKRAHRLLSEAAASGDIRAARFRASLLGTGTGCPADRDSAVQAIKRAAAAGDERSSLELILLARMSAHRPGPVERLNDSPLIEIHRQVLSEPECGYLKALAEPQFAPSVIVDPATGERRPDPVRTSDGMSFGPLNEDVVVNALNRRIASATGSAYGAGEPLHMLRYRGGQQYRPHSDALPDTDNPRVKTAIVYLNDDYQGGETEFPLLEITVKGRTGDVLLFANTDSADRPEPLSRHAGLPVTAGTKYIATRWIRARRYHPWA